MINLGLNKCKDIIFENTTIVKGYLGNVICYVKNATKMLLDHTHHGLGQFTHQELSVYTHEELAGNTHNLLKAYTYNQLKAMQYDKLSVNTNATI